MKFIPYENLKKSFENIQNDMKKLRKIKNKCEDIDLTVQREYEIEESLDRLVEATIHYLDIKLGKRSFFGVFPPRKVAFEVNKFARWSSENQCGFYLKIRNMNRDEYLRLNCIKGFSLTKKVTDSYSNDSEIYNVLISANIF
jgi:hypothetical protein